MMDWSISIRTSDKLVREYEHAIISYVTRQIRKDLNIMNQMSAAGQSAGDNQARAAQGHNRDHDMGQSTWLQDIFGGSGVSLVGLDQRSRDRCLWLQMFSQDLALRHCNELFFVGIVSLIQRVLSDSRTQNRPLTWMFVKQMIRHKLPDDSPRMLLETFVSMTRPDGMDISEWTSSCLLIVGLLLQQALLNLPAALAFSFWAGQITMPE